MGYVNSTTPALLSSTRILRVVFLPSFVSKSPPKPFKFTTSPTLSILSQVKAVVFPDGLNVVAGTLVLVRFADCSGGAAVVLRFRSSTILGLFVVGERLGAIAELEIVEMVS